MQLCAVALAEEWHSLPPQPQRLPVNASRNLKREKRVAEKAQQQGPVAEGDALTYERGLNHPVVAIEGIDADVEIAAGHRQLKCEVGVERDERRHIEELAGTAAEGVTLKLLRAHQVALALTEGIGDLAHHMRRVPLTVVAEVEGDGVEDVAERAHQSGEGDAGDR